ncbi:MAG: peptide chain release factor N(5)-glutamine methyltransferase [Bacilli bacterium]|nr:peptide chain release factor N(5)-glutamine methyltransferase [Bacilli bacterium]
MRDSDLEYLKRYLPKDRLEEGIKLLEKGISPQYIVGNVNFYGNIINVNNNVLIPRFETELLVDKTINYIRNSFFDISELKILDIGTGSGCIAIALKKELGCNVSAVDISSEALEVARNNALNNEVDVNFIESDIFNNLNNKFDVIISNPPYIRYDEEIEGIVKNNEPHLALYADEDGMYFYDKILKECREYLNDKYLIAFEIGYEQGDAVMKLAYKYLDNVIVRVEQDYSNKNRFVFIYRK